jgi:uncharacterized protein (DUF433 family)
MARFRSSLTPRSTQLPVTTGGRIVRMAALVSVIVSDPEVMSGTPCFRGTRVPLRNLMDYIEQGYPLAEFLEDFPTVSREMAVRALEEAKDSLIARIA